MNNISTIKEQVEQVLKHPINLEVLEHYTSDDYYSTNDSILHNEYWFESIEFPEEALERMVEELREEEYYEEDDLEYEARHKLEEALPYWTVYFQPRIEDIQSALKSNLVPFYYDGEFYLALGGCGMDLSPKLDAYQALTSGSIPSSSMFFRDRSYFEYVAGKELTKKIEEKIKREEPRIIISFYLYKDQD